MSKTLSETGELLTGIKNWIENTAVAKEAEYAETSGNARGAQNIVNALGSEVSMGSAGQPIYLSNGAFQLCNVMGGSDIAFFAHKNASDQVDSGVQAFILKFTNGLMIQGERYRISSNTEKTVNFPWKDTHPFTAIPLGFGSISARTSFSCWCETTSAWKVRQDSTSTYSCTLLAIGLWK